MAHPHRQTQFAACAGFSTGQRAILGVEPPHPVHEVDLTPYDILSSSGLLAQHTPLAAGNHRGIGPLQMCLCTLEMPFAVFFVAQIGNRSRQQSV